MASAAVSSEIVCVLNGSVDASASASTLTSLNALAGAAHTALTSVIDASTATALIILFADISVPYRFLFSHRVFRHSYQQCSICVQQALRLPAHHNQATTIPGTLHKTEPVTLPQQIARNFSRNRYDSSVASKAR
ncbi:hypothetical protein [Bifidobacterium breve]|uniref:hypothetical protein n=1 Tax=Bifidobacterium breve TaxID=1685 RepID=UPI001F439609|nr:hypothetical protein [Bifidobacterium breve]